jgi:hypothetical protein
MRWAGYVARIGDRRGIHKISVQKPKGKRQLRKPKRGWEDNTRMDLQELGWKGVDWTGMTQQEQVPDYCERGNEPSCSITFGKFLTS